MSPGTQLDTQPDSTQLTDALLEARPIGASTPVEPMQVDPPLPPSTEDLGSQVVVVEYDTQYRTEEAAGQYVATTLGRVVQQREIGMAEMAVCHILQSAQRKRSYRRMSTIRPLDQRALLLAGRLSAIARATLRRQIQRHCLLLLPLWILL